MENGKPSRSVIVRSLCRIALALLDLLLQRSSVLGTSVGIVGMAHQSAHGAVQSMPVVPSELGVGALERGVTVRLRLFDTALPLRQSLHRGFDLGVRRERDIG